MSDHGRRRGVLARGGRTTTGLPDPMLRVPSTSGSPVALRSRLGPRGTDNGVGAGTRREAGSE